MEEEEIEKVARETLVCAEILALRVVCDVALQKTKAAAEKKGKRAKRGSVKAKSDKTDKVGLQVSLHDEVTAVRM